MGWGLEELPGRATLATQLEALPEMTQRVNDSITAGVAGGAITVPWWIEAVSDGAEIALPILGAAWLIVQIIFKTREYYRGRNKQRAGQTQDRKDI